MAWAQDYYLESAADNPYGHFTADGTEFVVVDPHPPRPWVNVLANPGFGAVVSHSGSGFTFVDNSQLTVLTRWQQDLADDTSGKFLYLLDRETGEVWSASPAPVWTQYEAFCCRHGLGYTVFETRKGQVATSWTLLVHPSELAELWLVEVVNQSDRPRRLELTAYLEWNCGVAPSPRREFAKLFLETRWEAAHQAVLATAHMWDVADERWGHWNRDFPYLAAFGANRPAENYQADKGSFFGPGGHLRAPKALWQPAWPAHFGRHFDPIAALRYPLVLAPGERVTTVFVLAAGQSAEEALARFSHLCRPQAVEEALSQTRSLWQQLLAPHQLTLPEASLNHLVNLWSRYQAIAGRLWARCGYYQQSGAIGFRDQLQDAQVWLTIAPQRCGEQITLHAAHQFANGSAYHWWHPNVEQGLPSRYADDYLWLAFVTASYLKETGDWQLLHEPVRFVDDPQPFPLLEHLRRAFARAQKHLSPRGLPLIGSGDWNDGLSACGLGGRGESVWMAHFLALLAAEWSQVAQRLGQPNWEKELSALRQRLVEAVNLHGWDGEWFWRATTDDGQVLGSQHCQEGRIYLNAQTWAILADTTDRERQQRCWQAVK
ncbi:MAG: hypothetical protein N2447_06165, partial [Thermoanaerobaculum sp.]|nr:hypothetical protein [Thermoanaerobaculum sp.]